jgi:hypothetical protein
MIRMPNLFNSSSGAMNQVDPERERMMRIQNMRKIGRLNSDGSQSTVLMSSGEADGRFYAWPTLFPKNPESYTSDPSDWMEVEGWDGFDEAMSRGETFVFDTEEEAALFAMGSWKPTQRLPARNTKI